MDRCPMDSRETLQWWLNFDSLAKPLGRERFLRAPSTPVI
jgi:hypothetical protein